MKNFWVSWFHKAELGGFELHSPWWVSGARVVADRFNFDEQREEPTLCAAVQAVDETAAREVVVSSYDRRPEALEWRFCEPRPDDWTPFSGRFQKQDWMRWPPPVSQTGRR